MIERGHGPEETFFTFSYSHVPDDDGPGGVLAVLTVTTDKVVAARRLALLNQLAGGRRQAARPRRGDGRSARGARRGRSTTCSARRSTAGRSDTSLVTVGAARDRQRLDAPGRRPRQRHARRAPPDHPAGQRLDRGPPGTPRAAWVAAARARPGRTSRPGPGCCVRTRCGPSTRTTSGFLALAGRPGRTDPHHGHRAGSGAGPPGRRWPRSTPPRRRSSPTSATSSARP